MNVVNSSTELVIRAAIRFKPGVNELKAPLTVSQRVQIEAHPSLTINVDMPAKTKKTSEA